MKDSSLNFSSKATVALGLSGAFALPEHIIQALSKLGLSMDEITKLERHDPRLIEAINSYRHSSLTREYTELANERRSGAVEGDRLETLVEHFLLELEEYGYTSVINPENNNWIDAQSEAEKIIYPLLEAGQDYHFFYRQYMESEGIPIGKGQERFEEIVEYFRQHQTSIRTYWNCQKRMDEILSTMHLDNLHWDRGVNCYCVPDDFSLWEYYPKFMRYEVVKDYKTRREHVKWYIVSCPEIISYFMNKGNLSGMKEYSGLLVQLSELFAKLGDCALDNANVLVKGFCEKNFGADAD